LDQNVASNQLAVIPKCL